MDYDFVPSRKNPKNLSDGPMLIRDSQNYLYSIIRKDNKTGKVILTFIRDFKRNYLYMGISDSQRYPLKW